MEVSVLSQYQCSPREGHLDAIHRIFWYLKCSIKKKFYGRIPFDSSIPVVDDAIFNPSSKEMWIDFYPDAEETIPHDMPQPRGEAVKTVCYVDADHAGNHVCRNIKEGRKYS